MIRIRAPQSSDASAIAKLARSFPTPTPFTADVLSKIFESKLGDASSYIFVAEGEAGLIGYVSGYRHTAFYAGGDTAWVDEILVEENLRGRDIGRLLMAAFEERAAADGCKLVSLATASAGPFYSRLGYETKANYFKKYLRHSEQAIADDRAMPPSG